MLYFILKFIILSTGIYEFRPDVSTFSLVFDIDKVYRYISDQLLKWQLPYCRHWPLEFEVRDCIHRLSCARRGCRAGRSRARVRVNINKRSADGDVGAIPTVLSERAERRVSDGQFLRMYGGVLEPRTATLRRIKPVTCSPHQLTQRPVAWQQARRSV